MTFSIFTFSDLHSATEKCILNFERLLRADEPQLQAIPVRAPNDGLAKRR